MPTERGGEGEWDHTYLNSDLGWFLNSEPAVVLPQISQMQCYVALVIPAKSTVETPLH